MLLIRRNKTRIWAFVIAMKETFLKFADHNARQELHMGSIKSKANIISFK